MPVIPTLPSNMAISLACSTPMQTQSRHVSRNAASLSVYELVPLFSRKLLSLGAIHKKPLVTKFKLHFLRGLTIFVFLSS